VTARAGERPARTPVALAAAFGAIAVGIHFELFPWQLNVWLRAWWLHFFAVTATALGTGHMLGIGGAGSRREQVLRLRLACVVPFTLLALHELGQWLWPHEEHPDCLRDIGMNALGVTLAWWVLHRTLPPAAERRRGDGGAGGGT